MSANHQTDCVVSALRSTAAFVSALIIAYLGFMVPVVAGTLDDPIAHPAIPLFDESGAHVLTSGKPYSPRKSCGGSGCHDYDGINHSFHFEMGRDEARDDYGADRGLPHLVSPGYFGGYNCMGGSNPESLAKKTNATGADFGDLGAPDFVRRCKSCHAGGGFMERDRNGRRYDEVDPDGIPHLDGDYYSRGTDAQGNPTVTQWDWRTSGVVENDCLMCHVRFDELRSFDSRLPNKSGEDLAKDVRNYAMIDNGHFRYAATARLEFLNINRDGDSANDKSLVSLRRTDSDGDGAVNSKTDFDVDGEGNPILQWNATAFDTQGKTVIPMVRYPNNDNCMECHLTANSRRGFYGFGESAEVVNDEDGTPIEDYQDDVHKGLTWTEANGEERDIESCVACHTRNYYKETYGYQSELNASHNFLKGNSDMDLANHRDYSPPAKTCVYCHDDAVNPAIPSGHADMLSAHRELWKVAGDMTGYPQDTLTRITQTHLDVVSCEACHITNKQYRGSPLQIMYRYAASEDGKLRIRPYNARYRYYWKDTTSGRVLNATERNSAFRLETAQDGSRYGVVINPVTGAELGTVDVYFSHGAWRFRDPADYAGVVALKSAYDALLQSRGVASPNAVMVWSASNFYVMSHNTRPAVQALQCENCHQQTQSGSFSTLVSPNGVLGSANVKTVTTVQDKRLVDEGIIVFDYPTMKVSATGVVTENVADILYYSGLNPSLSRLNEATVRVVTGTVDLQASTTVLGALGLSTAQVTLLQQLMPSSAYVYLFNPRNGDAAVRRVAIMADKNGQADLLLPTYRFLIGLGDAALVNSAGQSAGNIAQVVRLEATNSNGQSVAQFPATPLFVKVPWSGTDASELVVVTSTDGNTWSTVDTSDIVIAQPAASGSDGFVVFRTDHFSYFAAGTTTNTSGGTTSGSGGGGGALLLLSLPLFLMRFGLRVIRRTRV